MKLLFDNNLSTKLPDTLTDYFPDSKHVFALQMLREVYSKDKDFYDIIDLLRNNVKPIADIISGIKSLMVLDH